MTPHFNPIMVKRGFKSNLGEWTFWRESEDEWEKQVKVWEQK